MALRCILMGGPGSGKGTMVKAIKEHFDFESVASGDLLRWHIHKRTPLGLAASSHIAKGRLVPDKLIIQLLLDQLAPLAGQSWLLDGFPRTLTQARALDKHLEKLQQPLSMVLQLDVPESVILARVQNRWIHEASGRTYNDTFNPPCVKGRDDVTGEPLMRRIDDNVAAFQQRLEDHRADSAPLLSHYRDRGLLQVLQGTTSKEIYPQIEALLVERGARLRSFSSSSQVPLDGQAG